LIWCRCRKKRGGHGAKKYEDGDDQKKFLRDFLHVIGSPLILRD